MTSSLECSPSTGFPISAMRLASSSSDVSFLSATSERARARRSKIKRRNRSEKDSNQNKRMLSWLACRVVLHSMQTKHQRVASPLTVGIYSAFIMFRQEIRFVLYAVFKSHLSHSVHSGKLWELLQWCCSEAALCGKCWGRLDKLACLINQKTLKGKYLSRSISLFLPLPMILLLSKGVGVCNDFQGLTRHKEDSFNYEFVKKWYWYPTFSKGQSTWTTKINLVSYFKISLCNPVIVSMLVQALTNQ